MSDIAEKKPTNQQKVKLLCNQGPAWQIRSRGGKADKRRSCSIKDWDQVDYPTPHFYQRVYKAWQYTGMFIARPACHKLIIVDVDNPAKINDVFRDV